MKAFRASGLDWIKNAPNDWAKERISDPHLREDKFEI